MQALLRFVVAAQIIGRLCTDYEDKLSSETCTRSGEHHECYVAFQKNFYNDYQKLATCMEILFDPFNISYSNHLCYLSNGKPMDNAKAVSDSLRQLENIGQQQFRTFCSERIIQCTVPLTAAVTRNNIYCFLQPGI